MRVTVRLRCLGTDGRGGVSCFPMHCVAGVQALFVDCGLCDTPCVVAVGVRARYPLGRTRILNHHHLLSFPIQHYHTLFYQY